jgi:hypothetical protein
LALRVEHAGVFDAAEVRLYRDDGTIDDGALEALRRVANGGDAPLAPRLAQLAFRAAYHFQAERLVVISAFRPLRKGKGGYHATGEALDFQLKGVEARRLASYLRTLPRAGVGIYTHPHTQFVHLDVREVSYHWRDGSPPGKHWKEARLADPRGAERDRQWTPESDLPEGWAGPYVPPP